MSDGGEQDLAGLIRRAGQGGGLLPEARAAQAELEAGRLADPSRLPAILAALHDADPASLAAAGLWLFDPQTEAPRLMAELVEFTDELYELVSLREPQGWAEGLARVLALAGGRNLRCLLDMARPQAWAREVMAELPLDLNLPGGDTPPLRLAVLEVGAATARRAVHLARSGRWTELARQAGSARQDGADNQAGAVLALAQADVGCRQVAVASAALSWPGGDLDLLEVLAAITAREGQRAHELAVTLAAAAQGPVLLMGNASLGGPPLWAVPGPWQQGADWPAKLSVPP
ncbi:MAG: hypothetical protein V1797_02830, partial [Pseudomonadota bacterium]